MLINYSKFYSARLIKLMYIIQQKLQLFSCILAISIDTFLVMHEALFYAVLYINHCIKIIPFQQLTSAASNDHFVCTELTA